MRGTWVLILFISLLVTSCATVPCGWERFPDPDALVVMQCLDDKYAPLEVCFGYGLEWSF